VHKTLIRPSLITCHVDNVVTTAGDLFLKRTLTLSTSRKTRATWESK